MSLLHFLYLRVNKKKQFTSCGFPKGLKGESVQSTGVGQLSLGLSLCLCGCCWFLLEYV